MSHTVEQPARVMEFNFVIKKFMELPDAERLRIYHALKGPDKKALVHASAELVDLIVGADPVELTAYANTALDAPFTQYVVWDEQEDRYWRAILLYEHFSVNLKLEGGRVSIDPIPNSR